jgi:hypothetical protein
VVELPHDLDFFDETLFSIFLAVGGFFGEGFDGVVEMVVEFLNEVDRGEVAFTDFFDWFELFVEAFLVEVDLEDFLPLGGVFVGQL